jgi:hypothetical protein
MNSLLDRTRQALWLVWRWLPTRELVVVGDRAYAAIEWLDAVRQVGYVITRFASTRHSMSLPPKPAATERVPAQEVQEAADPGEGLDWSHDALEVGHHGELVRRRGASCPDHFQHRRLVSRG